MTGRYPLRCGVTANPAPDFGGQYTELGLPTSEITLAELFHRAGYATGMVGKWHLGHAKKEFYPVRRGFDEYLGILYSNDMRPVQLIDGEQVVEYPVVQATLTERYTTAALNSSSATKTNPSSCISPTPCPISHWQRQKSTTSNPAPDYMAT